MTDLSLGKWKISGARLVPWLVALAAAGWYAWPLLHPDYQGRDGDSLFLFLPGMRLARAELLAGRMPLWNPYKFLGTPFLADLMIPIFYPPMALAVLLGGGWGLQWVVVAHYGLAAAGAYALARRGAGAGRAGAALAGLTFALSGTLSVLIGRPIQLFATAWLPWVWLAGLALARGERKLKGVLLLGLALGMEMLASQPQIVFYSLLAVGLSAVFYLRRGSSADGHNDFPRSALEQSAIRNPQSAIENAGGTPALHHSAFRNPHSKNPQSAIRNPQSWNWRVWPALAAAGVLAGMLAAVLWLPAWDLSHYSVTRHGNYNFAISYSLPWRNLWTLLLPGVLGTPATGGYRGEWNFAETTIFMGQAGLALSLIGLWAGRRRRPTWLLAATLAVGLVLALGGNTPVYRPLTRLLPPLLGFRAPARAFCLVALAASVLAGLGLDAVQRRLRLRPGILGLREREDPGETPAPQSAFRLTPSAWLAFVLIALQLAGLGWFRWGLLGLDFESGRVLERPGLARMLAEAGAQPERTGRIFRLLDEGDYNDLAPAAVRQRVDRLQPDINQLFGYRGYEGYDEGMLPTGQYIQFSWHFWRNLYTPRPDSLLLGLMGVEWLLSDSRKPLAGGAGWVRAGAYEDVTLWHNQAYRGEVFTRAHWPEVDWERVGVPGRVAAHNQEPVDLWRKPAAAPAAPLRYQRSAPGRVEVRLPEGFAGELLLSESWLPGWRAEIEGGAVVEGRPVNPELIAFQIPPGARYVTLRYAPRIFNLGLATSGLGLALVLAGWLWLRRRGLPGVAAPEAGAA